MQGIRLPQHANLDKANLEGESCRRPRLSESGNLAISGREGTREPAAVPDPRLDSRTHGFRALERLDRLKVGDQMRLLILFDGSAASR